MPENVTDKEIKEAAESVTFSAAFRFWVWLGFVSFGGPAGQIALMHRELVERKKWIGEEKFLHALNFCMLLPGPEAQQLAIYNGWRLHGTWGGVVAGAFFVVPSIFILLVLSYIYAAYGSVPAIAGILDGLKAVVLAIVVEAVFKVGKKALKGWQPWAIAAAAFVAIYFLHIPFPLVVVAAALIGFLTAKFGVQAEKVEPKEQAKIEQPKLNTIQKTLVFAGLWVVPLVIAGAVFGWRSLPVKLYLFFTQAAFVTFGGAYAVLAYVNQAAVNSYGWITTEQAIDGFALAETTPGPLIMVLQNVGFMAGWNNPQDGFSPIFFAVVCALLTTAATFLPCFWFVFAFAPLIERLQNNEKLKSALSSVTAAVVGVILTLAVSFGAAVVFRGGSVDVFALLIGAAAFFALFRFKLDVLWLIAAGGLLGLCKVLLTN
jgi:chromate transporter